MLDEDELNNEKWSPIINNIGLTGSKADWMSQYINNFCDNNLGAGLTSSNENFPSLLPIAMKVAAHTIGTNLVSVQPMGDTSENIERIEKEVLSENRDRKIEAVINNKKYEEMKIEEHPDYRGPSGKLFYLDFKYGSSKKKNKKRK